MRDLLQRFGSAEDILKAARAGPSRLELDKTTRKALAEPDAAAIEHDLAWLDQPDHHLITFADAAYPELLRQIPDPPPVLFVRGRTDILCGPQLAMVGSRNPTAAGRRTAREFAVHLARSGLTITSGLAIGIDAASHEGALQAGGVTIAVCANGLDVVYPARHAELAARIAQTGAVLSEFPPGMPPLPEHFPRRNRIISGLSVGTLVVEAAVRSGSLITARLANEQGREVFAIPGSIHNPLARGCHRLLKDGAKLVESAADILDELAPLAAINAAAQPTSDASMQDDAPLDDEYRLLLQSIGFAPTAVDEIVERTGLTPGVVSSMLLALELRGHVESAPGGRYSRVSRGP